MNDYKFTEVEISSFSIFIQAIRRVGTITRPEISRVTGFSRTLVSKFVDLALSLDLLVDGELGASSGGRAPQLLNFNFNAGSLLIVQLGANGMSVATSDLLGNVAERIELDTKISEGPVKVLADIEKAFNRLITKNKLKNIWGIGVGLPGPVEFATGRPISPPIMPGWDRFPVRDQFSAKYGVPVWVDNDVNLMALGEISKNYDEKNNELIYIKIGSGIGAGIITRGQLHRGAQGCAGDIGHIAITEPTEVVCRCGNVGCLEAIAGGISLARDASAYAKLGTSKFLRDRLKTNKTITSHDVIEGANSGDKWCVDAINAVGRQVGKILATLVNFHNPSLIVIGGGVSDAGDKLLAAIRETVFQRSLPLATRDLEIRLGERSDLTGLNGTAEMVVSELFAPKALKQWVNTGYPDSSLVH